MMGTGVLAYKLVAEPKSQSTEIKIDRSQSSNAKADAQQKQYKYKHNLTKYMNNV